MSQRGRVLPLTVPGGQSRVYTVSQLTNDIKNALEDRFGVVIVQGEVTSLRHASSGHSYFCLKDAQSQISVVLYADRTTTAIRNTIQEGIALQVEGDITVFAKRGEYQIRALRIEPVGYGALQAQFEALKRKLEAEGLFAPERKRDLPRYPTRIGIVTSEDGAALRDMVRILRTRAPYVSITLGDARVQGEGAAQDIAQALARMNAFGEVEVIVVGRGGGSPQDLWAFNEEAVVRAIVRSRIPVVSAVGHEVDVTLADLAADVRAATPTHAAQIVVKDVEEIRRTLLDLSRHARERIVREFGEEALILFNDLTTDPKGRRPLRPYKTVADFILRAGQVFQNVEADFCSQFETAAPDRGRTPGAGSHRGPPLARPGRVGGHAPAEDGASHGRTPGPCPEPVLRAGAGPDRGRPPARRAIASIPDRPPAGAHRDRGAAPRLLRPPSRARARVRPRLERRGSEAPEARHGGSPRRLDRGPVLRRAGRGQGHEARARGPGAREGDVMKRKEPDTGSPPAEISFEQMMERLEALVSRLERGDLSLEESIQAYEEGTKLAKQCKAVLAEAEKRIQRLTQEGAAPAAASRSDVDEEERGADELPF